MIPEHTTEKRPFYSFTDYESETWRILFERMWHKVEARACEMYLNGHRLLNLTAARIPDFAVLDKRFRQLTGWELVSTNVQYSDGQTWFEHLIRREFLITEYIRERDTLDYTPLPDIFHDAFGHLPMQINQRYADLVEQYAHLMLECPKERRAALGSIWWYTIEFGFIKERGELKTFGTGLMSSYGEYDEALSDRVERRPFDPEDIAKHKPSPHEMHKILWVMEDFEQLEEFVATQRQKYSII
jgi:phenylalanine-4-hydroxylase